MYNGQCIVIAIMDKRMTDPPYYAELGHCYPSTVANTDNVKRHTEASGKKHLAWILVQSISILS